MNTLGYFLILTAILIARQVFKGRVMQLGEDMSDAFLALVSGDTKGLTTVLARTGDANQPTQATSTTLSPDNVWVDPKDPVKPLAKLAINRGNAAKGYRMTATGPDSYDCSGLMYRACQDAGYTGPRFTTSTISGNKAFKRISASGMQGPNIVNAGVNDIVCWTGHHMGVITGPNQFYSARNPQVGIGYAKISGFRNDTPVYYRFIG